MTLKTTRPEKVTQTMQARRAKILWHAHDLLAHSEDSDFSLRNLATAAEVTVPTIYNLIGSKSDILFAMQEDFIVRIEVEVSEFTRDEGLEMAEAIVVRAVEMIAADERYFRSAILAQDKVMRAHDVTSGAKEIGNRAAAMQTAAVTRVQQTKMMQGDISADIIGRQIFRNYQLASQEWVHRRISLEQFKHRALLGVYICLMADANDALKQTLKDKIHWVDARC
ncbi:MAG: AcrR family transcriptional regulator [Candidatus Azotimanducaceae bacterium]